MPRTKKEKTSTSDKHQKPEVGPPTLRNAAKYAPPTMLCLLLPDQLDRYPQRHRCNAMNKETIEMLVFKGMPCRIYVVEDHACSMSRMPK